MLRVGLTGDLGSGKSTVAQMLAAHGAIVLSSDEMGRAMMQPGERVYDQIVAHFGPSVVASEGTLNRAELARLAFDPNHPRVEELNAIVHPAVIHAQAERIAELAKSQPHAIIVIESALIFSTKHAGGSEPWKDRFDAIVLVTAPEAIKVARFVERSSTTTQSRAQLESEARRRLALQQITPEQQAECIVIENDGDRATLQNSIDALWNKLQALEAASD